MRKWILNFIEISILIIIILACVASILQSTLFKNKSIYGYRSYVIASNSMYPVLEYGDVILIKEIDFDSIEVDDIVTYMGTTGEFKNKIITHEVIEIVLEDDVKYLKTKGRANTGIDPAVYEEQVYGKLVYKFMVISLISKVVRDEIGFVLFIFIPFGILFVLEFINLIKESKRKELEKMMLEHLEELKKLNNRSEKAVLIENTICLQLEEVKNAKRDFKKMNQLANTVQIPFLEIVDEIEKLKKDSKENKKVNKNIDMDKTMILFESDDIKKEIDKELKNKTKSTKKVKKTSKKTVSKKKK